MTAFLTTLILGLLICVIGVINMTGNISSLHSYHRKRVTEEDRKPFGRLVGMGTLIIGVSLILYGVLFFVYEKTQINALVIVGTSELIIGIVAGLVISFFAMIKYYRGIF